MPEIPVYEDRDFHGSEADIGTTWKPRSTETVSKSFGRKGFSQHEFRFSVSASNGGHDFAS
jgi:hypothetical protein